MSNSSRFAGSARSGCWASFQRFWSKSYAADYLALIAVTLSHVLLGLFFLNPFHPEFTLDDPRIQHPYALHERVPVLALFLLSGVVPLSCLLTWAAVARPGLHKMHVTLLGLFTSFFVTSFLTDLIKNAVGRPRPDLVDRCKPEPGAPAHGYVTYKICTQKNPYVLEDGFRSFPSGHSSFAFCGLGYLSIFLLAQLRVLSARGVDTSRTLLAFAPMLGAVLIALSRYEDYRHDPYDISVGSLLGLSVAYFSWRRHYPALRSRNCDVPYLPKESELNEPREMRMRDEEEMVGGPGDFAIGEEGMPGEEVPLTSMRRPS